MVTSVSGTAPSKHYTHPYNSFAFQHYVLYLAQPGLASYNFLAFLPAPYNPFGTAETLRTAH